MQAGKFQAACVFGRAAAGFSTTAAIRGKATEGRRRVAPESDEGGSPGRWCEFHRPTNGAERLGVRQPSGAFEVQSESNRERTDPATRDDGDGREFGENCGVAVCEINRAWSPPQSKLSCGWP
jgi:hypothetical protein